MNALPFFIQAVDALVFCLVVGRVGDPRDTPGGRMVLNKEEQLLSNWVGTLVLFSSSSLNSMTSSIRRNEFSSGISPGVRTKCARALLLPCK